VGQRLTFLERYEGGWRTIATAGRARGTVRFAPGDGKAGTREVWVAVHQNGMLRERLRVARYRAPGRALPGRPRRVRVRRRGSTLRVTWAPATRAVRYRVVVRLSDGRRRTFMASRRRRSITMRGVVRGVRGSVRVTGLRADMLRGPTATAPVRRR
jgi:hypothetical protein